MELNTQEAEPMNQAVTQKDGLPDPLTTSLDQLDVADPRRFEHDTWQPLFERLRRESPVHYQAHGPDSAPGIPCANAQTGAARCRVQNGGDRPHRADQVTWSVGRATRPFG